MTVGEPGPEGEGRGAAILHEVSLDFEGAGVHEDSVRPALAFERGIAEQDTRGCVADGPYLEIRWNLYAFDRQVGVDRASRINLFP